MAQAAVGSIKGGDSVVANSLFIADPIVEIVLSLDLVLLCSTSCPFLVLQSP